MRLTHSRVASSLLVVSSGLIHRALADSHVARDSADFSWASLASSSNLSWTPCYDAFQCARFTVPLQYSNLSAGEAQIALVMSPSDFTSGDEDYLGPILFNPGGPGGSGVQYILEFADYFRAIIGPKYDLVGFDPRAVGQTTPPLSVFESPVEALEFYGDFPLNSNESVASLGQFYTKSKILSNLVLDKAKVVAESVSTAAVATDMLGIIKAFGFEKLSYWGISYGSVIGATYAAMFPDNINRLLIDGVFNSHDWYEGNLFSSLQDTDNALASVYEACREVGPALCAIYENTTDLISARVNKIINDVHILPVPVYNSTDLSSITFGSVDYSVLISELFRMIDSPYALATVAAEGLVQLEQGISGSITFQGTIAQGIVEQFATCDFDSSQPFVDGLVAANAIQCGDVLVDQTLSFPEVQEVYAQNAQASLFAPQAFNTIISLCTTWPPTIAAKDRFSGSFTTNTSSPILLVGNTFDPITPIAGARNMSAGFAGSVVLQQNSTGHTSLSSFSTCTALAIHAYFADGTLPAAGTVCQPDTAIFQNPANSSAEGGVNITIPGARRGEPEVYTLREAVGVVGRSSFLARNGVFGRRMRRAF